MALNFLARSLSEKLQRSVRFITPWRRCRVTPLTFEQLERQRSAAAGSDGRRTSCTCPHCRHARRSEDE